MVTAPYTSSRRYGFSAPKHMQPLTELFLWQYRENYFLGLTPANRLYRAEPGSQALVALYTRMVGANQVSAFTGLLREAQYLVNLWAAHLLVEHFHPDAHTRKQCLLIIEAYAAGSVDPKLASEEQEWLKHYS
ncbi:hypothetical protein GCM10011495_39300 [Hymenobacter frigidus]|uniref:Uncharacterized protein n=2 Tax=Hymenobacter frigidus TaxID=1524095 RepID=A0ABQ2AK92_9BACT|nr:hypothetical protein GCM10011495_39300 [Hymenobacter frigidus]